MRPVLFAVCFTLGVSLMICSGYLPKSASAKDGSPSATDAAPGTPVTDNYRPYRRPPIPRFSRGAEGTPAVEETDDAWLAEPEPEDIPAADEFDNVSADLVIIDPLDAAAAEAAEALRNLGADLETIEPEPSELEPAEPEPIESPPAAHAGDGRIVWIGWDEVTLNGSASTGSELSYAWTQVAGPALVIKDPDKARTAARGFPLGPRMSWAPELYTFELLVTDERGRWAVDQVDFVVLSAPELEFTPPAERFFDLRDGYLLAHYEAWMTNLETAQSTFLIVSPTAVTFAKVTGASYDLVDHRTDGGYEYEITVYQGSPESTSWVEFLVNTDEKIPGVVQLGVSWDGQ